MSASPMARQLTENKAIPTKRVVISDPLDMPADYSSTPGGTLFSTTPGGSRIVYERSFLIKLSNSPISKTPPTKFDIPEALLRGAPNKSPNNHHNNHNNNNNSQHNHIRSYKPHPVTKKARSPLVSVSSPQDDEQFQLDM